jgi:hypothetical protein
MAHRKGLRKSRIRPPLTIKQILKWADQHFEEHGRYPNVNSGVVSGTFDEVWRRLDEALCQGRRGLPKKPRSSLAQLLEKCRGVRNSEFPPKLSLNQIAKWAHHHYLKTGKWPRANTGPVDGAPGETWLAIDMALRKGVRRGLPQGSSLAKFLHRRFGVRNLAELPQFTVKQVLAWADAHIARTGRRPVAKSGPIPEAPNETWLAVDKALRKGSRGFRGKQSLAQLLDRHRPGTQIRRMSTKK